MYCHLDDPDKFTVRMEHNGFFCGLKENLAYISGTCDFWDNCSRDTFSLIWIHDFITFFGHEINERLNVYWCLPDSLLDGLFCIENDAHILAMTEAVAVHKTLTIMIDHTNFLKGLRDDVLINGGPQLPPIVSPKKVPTIARTGTSTEEMQWEDYEGEGDGDTDFEFYDSDYDAEDGDDDIFYSYVDEDVNDNNAHTKIVEQEDDAGLEHEDLELTKEQHMELKYKFSTFNAEVDMESPAFKVGMIFSCMKEFRSALTAYSIKERVKINKVRNESTRLDGYCNWEGCPWFIKVAKDTRKGGAIVVKKFHGEHRCERYWDLKVLTTPFLCQYFIDEFRDNQKMDLKTFAAKITRKFNMCPNRFKLGRARKEALNIIHGSEAEQFSLLWDYGQELRRSNPGSKNFLSTNKVKGPADLVPKEHLATLYWSYDDARGDS
jgi:hypothetical protein